MQLNYPFTASSPYKLLENLDQQVPNTVDFNDVVLLEPELKDLYHHVSSLYCS
ncbi:MAG: hypothetical protein ACFFD4_28010 [Candidatus Odinarchaeota archaeon]